MADGTAISTSSESQKPKHKDLIKRLLHTYAGGIKARTGVGVVFGHQRKGQFGRFDDGHLMRTSDVVAAEREGRFWVITIENSRYVIATFQRPNGRASLSEFLRIASG